MKVVLFTLVCALVIGILPTTAFGQNTLPVADQGAVLRSYFGPSTYSGVWSGPSSMYVGFYPSPASPTIHLQGVVELSLPSNYPNAANAMLSFGVPTLISGTWTLWARLDSDDGVLGVDDFYGGSGSFSQVGTFNTAATGSGTIGFDIASFLNDDFNAGNSYSTYVLTHQGLTGPGANLTLLTPVTYTPVPEPGTLILFGAGLFAFAAGYRIRKRKANAA